jgi:transglutaminase-like putative cysteine protease
MYTYRFLLAIEKASDKIYLIYPLPKTNEYQLITDLNLTANNVDDYENSILIAKEDVTVSFNAILKRIDKIIDPALSLSKYVKSVKHLSAHYTGSDRFIDPADQAVKAMAERIVGKSENVGEIVQKLYDATVQQLTYGNPTEGLYSYKQALEQKVTDCGGFSTLLSSLLRARQIPTRLVVGHIVKRGTIDSLLMMIGIKQYTMASLSMHAWLEIPMPDGSWFPMDPSMEWRRKNNLTKRNGGFGTIPADRLVLSYGEDTHVSIDGKQYHFDLLQHPQSL